MTSQPFNNTDNPIQPKLRLTQEDVKRLLSEPAPEARVAVIQKITEDHSAGHFRPNEILIAEQIFRLLLRDAEVQVRAAMAEGLKHDATVPKDIIRSLASDDEAVALPLLTHSDVLDDNDLVEIIRQNVQITKHIAIANRRSVSPSVSAALVDTENNDVVSTLVQNQGASISEQSYTKIVEDFGKDSDIINVVVKRANLPVAVVENLLNLVSDSVAQELKNKYTGASRKLEDEARKTRESMTLRLLETTVEPQQVTELVEQLYDTHRLTPSIILTALCRGNFTFFEYSLAKMAGIPSDNARKLINDKGELGFKSLYKKAGLPDSMFEACRLVLDVMREMHEKSDIRPGSIHYANRAVEKILMYADGQEIENLAYIIALIRQNVH